MALYTYCLVATKEANVKDIHIEELTEKEYGMIRLENVGDVLFQALLLDDVSIEKSSILAEVYTVYISK